MLPPTLRDLLRVEGLGVVMRSGTEAPGAPPSWVRTNEPEDATPFRAGALLPRSQHHLGLSVLT